MATAYHILPQGQSVRTVLSPSGQGFIDVREISGVVDDGPARGTRFTVRVYADGATAETVRAALAQEVAHLTEVAMLGGTGVVE